MPVELPTCRHRGRRLAADAWECRCPDLVLPTGAVSSVDCALLCHCPDREDRRQPAVLVDGPRCEISLAVLTAPRAVRTVERTLRELRRGGFEQTIYVFQEPGAGVVPQAGLRVTTNPVALGLWDNWRSSAAALVDQTDAEFILICEDDLYLAPCAALALEHALRRLPRADFGYASLYTPMHNAGGLPRRRGWRTIQNLDNYWGSLAYCYTRESLEAVLHSRAVVEHTGNLVDNAVSRAFQELDRKCYFHFPSLVCHAGDGLSTLGHASAPRSLAVDFDYEDRSYVESAAVSPRAPTRK